MIKLKVGKTYKLSNDAISMIVGSCGDIFLGFSPSPTGVRMMGWYENGTAHANAKTDIFDIPDVVAEVI